MPRHVMTVKIEIAAHTWSRMDWMRRHKARRAFVAEIEEFIAGYYHDNALRIHRTAVETSYHEDDDQVIA